MLLLGGAEDGSQEYNCVRNCVIHGLRTVKVRLHDIHPVLLHTVDPVRVALLKQEAPAAGLPVDLSLSDRHHSGPHAERCCDNPGLQARHLLPHGLDQRGVCDLRRIEVSRLLNASR